MIWSLTAQFLLSSEVTCMKLTYEQTIRHITRNFFLHLPHLKTSLLRYIYYYTMLWCSIFDKSRSLYFLCWCYMALNGILQVQNHFPANTVKSSSNISGRSNWFRIGTTEWQQTLASLSFWWILSDSPFLTQIKKVGLGEADNISLSHVSNNN